MGKSARALIVVGAGVSGLTTAVTLAEAGEEVRVVADEVPLCTTSAAAGASWGPYMVNHPLAAMWSDTTHGVLTGLAAQGIGGVRMVAGLEAAREEVNAPQWAQELASFRLCDATELPDGYVTGWRYEMPVVNMLAYLEYLNQRLSNAGVTVETTHVDSLTKLCDTGHMVINCTGVGARELCGDATLIPTRGQLVVVDNPGLRTFFQDHSEGEELTYYLPHDDHVVLGGSARDWDTDLTPDLEVAQAILMRCAQIEPRLAGVRVREHRVGLRPSRKMVRVEREGMVIHNYGHGGAGVTLSWGCAQSVLELIAD